jgi:hypothetical protein
MLITILLYDAKYFQNDKFHLDQSNSLPGNTLKISHLEAPTTKDSGHSSE